MDSKENKRVYMIISIVIIIILSIFIIVVIRDINGKSSKQIKASYNFLRILENDNGISQEKDIKINDFKDVERISDFSNIKYTLANNDYVFELNEDYQVIGFFEQNVKKLYGVKELTSEECKRYSKKYLNSIYKEDVVFKEIKDKDVEENPFYTFTYYKMHNDYICYSSEIWVNISKYDGSLVGYSNYSEGNGEFLSNININEDESKNIFFNYMKELGVVGEIVNKPKIGYFNIDGDVNQICYLINYRITEEDNKIKFSDVIINADTGDIVKHSNNIVELLPNENNISNEKKD